MPIRVRSFVALLLFWSLSACLAAQTANTAPGTPSLSASVSLVVTDVTVTDKEDNPVKNLKAPDFVVQDGGERQGLKGFDEHVSTVTEPPPVDLKLGPDMFSDLVPVAGGGPLNVLLIDTLNTPQAGQAYLRSQLIDYLKHADPHAPVAIFALGQRLSILQGFTTDPSVLRNFVEHRESTRTPALNAGTGNQPSQALLDAHFGSAKEREVISQFRQFESEATANIAGSRVRLTLDAFNLLARYLGAMPGRKNLIWFSGSFPLTLFPDPTIAKPFEGTLDVSADLESTSRLMSSARIAVYPVDVRGLQSSPIYDATEAHGSYARAPDGFDLKHPDRWTMNPSDNATADSSRAQNTAQQEHASMQQVAAVTGGHAFFNTNGIVQAVRQAMAAGSDYYTLSWSPPNRDSKASTWHKVRVELVGDLRKRGYHLSYREGYLPAFRPSDGMLQSNLGPAQGPASHLSDLLMTHGAPSPSDILFKVRVSPEHTQSDNDLLQADHPNSKHPIQGPYRRLLVELVALTQDLHLQLGTDGKYAGRLSLILCSYTDQGSLLNAQQMNYTIAISPADYQRLSASGFRAQSVISVPDSPETFLRIGLRNDTNDRIGVVEIRTSQIVPLPPKLTTTVKPVIAPLLVKSPAALDVSRLTMGTRVTLQAVQPWAGLDCALPAGATVEAQVGTLERRTKANTFSQLELILSSADCTGHDGTPIALEAVELVAPLGTDGDVPEDVDAPLLASRTTLGSEHLHGATTQSSEAQAKGLQRPESTVDASLPPQQSNVVRLPGTELYTGAGSHGGSLLINRKQDVRLPPGTLLLLRPATQTEGDRIAKLQVAEQLPVAIELEQEASEAQHADSDELCSEHCVSLSASDVQSVSSVRSVPLWSLHYLPHDKKPRTELNRETTLSFVDENTLLFTFDPHGVRPHAVGSEEGTRLVRAVLIDTKSFKVRRVMEWQTVGDGAFLWPAGDGQTLIRTTEGLELLDRRLAVKHRLALEGKLVFVVPSPSGDRIAVGTTSESLDPDDRARLSRSMAAAPEERVHVQLLNKDLKLMSEAEHTTRSAIPVLLDTGELHITPDGSARWKLTMWSWDGKQHVVTTLKSTCKPRISAPSEDLIFARGCSGAGVHWYRMLKANGRVLLKANARKDEFLQTADQANANDFAVRLVHAGHTMVDGQVFGRADLTQEDVVVYRNEDGRALGVVRTKDFVLSQNAYALSPKGDTVVVAGSGDLQFFQLPAIQETHRSPMARAQ